MKININPHGAKITGKQVNMLMALGIKKELRGDALLEFIEFECQVNVAKLEDIRTGDFGRIKVALEAA